MAYTKTVWTNGSGQPINADNLNKIEQGIYCNSVALLTSGTSTNYTLIISGLWSSYSLGAKISIIMHATNTGSATININSLGSKALKKNDGSDYAAGELVINTPYTFVYNGTDFLADSSGGMGEFFGDGTDGVIPDLNTCTTAPNGGTVANLWDMNAGTTFTTGSLSSAADQVVFSIDFQSPQSLPNVSGFDNVFYGAVISTGAARVLRCQYSDDGISWTAAGGATISTLPVDHTGATGNSTVPHRYWRWLLLTGGSTCTFTCQGVTLNKLTGDTQTTKVWRITYPVTAQSGLAVKNFTSLALPAGHTITTDVPCQGLILYSQGDVNISGTIDMSQKAGLAPNGNAVPMLITKKAMKTAKTSSLLHFDNNLTDANGRNWTNNGSATFDATNKKFGTHAISFNGTTQWVDTPASDDFSFGADDFTIDFWVRPTSVGTLKYLLGDWNSAASYYSLFISQETTGSVWFGVTPTEGAIIIAKSNTLMIANNWYHIVATKNNNNLQLFVNGVLESSVQCIASIKKSIYKMSLGRAGEFGSNYFAGQIDEFRIVKGKAMYTANFTPPTSEYTYTATYTDTPKTLEKYYQLTTVLQALRGGYGGNGGYGGGYSGSTGRQTSVGVGRFGRQNLGGFGGGGSGGGISQGSVSGGIGGNILFSECGNGSTYVGSYNTGTTIIILNGYNGSAGIGAIYSASTNGFTGRCLGGGVGGSGGMNGNTTPLPIDSQYSGGLITIISKGNIVIEATGIIKSNGGNGSNGTNGTGTSAGGGGGGGGAGGGVIAIFHKGNYTNNGTLQVDGGSGGTAGTGSSTGESGGSGTSGSVGSIISQML